MEMLCVCLRFYVSSVCSDQFHVFEIHRPLPRCVGHDMDVSLCFCTAAPYIAAVVQHHA